MQLKRYSNFVNESVKVKAYDEEKYPSVHAYLKATVSEHLGKPNSYSSSADWGGLDVWSVKGDKFEGTFVVIDDNDNVILMTRKHDEKKDEYVDKDILSAKPEDDAALNKLLNKALKIKNDSSESLVNEGKTDRQLKAWVISVGKINPKTGNTKMDWNVYDDPKLYAYLGCTDPNGSGNSGLLLSTKNTFKTGDVVDLINNDSDNRLGKTFHILDSAKCTPESLQAMLQKHGYNKMALTMRDRFSGKGSKALDVSYSVKGVDNA